MILTLDVGNSQIYGGVFDGASDEASPNHNSPSSAPQLPAAVVGTSPYSPPVPLRLQFRMSSKTGASSDEYGLFLRSVLRENGVEPSSIKRIALCSVVPDLIHSLKGACGKYFGMNPFILQAGTKTGLKVRYRNPVEVGADRIANAIGAAGLFPGKNLVIADFGTATTFCAISADRDYLGGLIVPGFRLAMESLESGTAKLPTVEIVVPQELVGRSTVESIQSGLYHGNLAIVRELSRRIRAEYFGDANTVVIGTGGFSRLFEREGVFDALIPELVHLGLRQALQLNA